MFPLGTVLFPYARLPLHVFEPRYRVMTRHVIAGDQEFGVVLIERGSEVGGGDTRFDIGTVARVVRAAELPDGRFALDTIGTRRIRVHRWLPDDPFPRAEVVALDEPSATPGAFAARDRVVGALEELVAVARTIDPGVTEIPAIDPDPQRAAYEAAALAPIGPLDAQRVLESPNAEARLALLASLISERAAELRARRTLDD
ncbi:MAG TPA: LON peptidase substrate-binding domain-containing protein [Acidimicrobiia bacterium]|nr:LON peptidase substrate-binding domain-containing protein [Acidimicrobiia bacterium]